MPDKKGQAPVSDPEVVKKEEGADAPPAQEKELKAAVAVVRAVVPDVHAFVNGKDYVLRKEVDTEVPMSVWTVLREAFGTGVVLVKSK